MFSELAESPENKQLYNSPCAPLATYYLCWTAPATLALLVWLAVWVVYCINFCNMYLGETLWLAGKYVMQGQPARNGNDKVGKC